MQSASTTFDTRSTANLAAGSAPPRVAVVTNSVTPYRQYLHEQLVREVPEVELWTLTTHGNAYQRWADMAVPPSIRPVSFGQGEPTNEQAQLRYSLREWRKAGRIISWLKEHQVAAVLCQGCGDVGRLRILRWCRRNNIPCFLTGDFNIRGENLSRPMHWLKKLTYSLAVKCSTGLMPCGKLGRDLLVQYGGAKKPVFWFPFFPDVEVLSNTPAELVARTQAKYSFLTNGQRRLVFSARLMPVKRPDLAVQAFVAIASERTDWDLVMVGDGPLRAEVEAMIPPDYRPRIHFTGFVSNPSEMAGIYASCDALLLPSQHEPWGVVIVEAAAAGLAIITTDVVGAVPELVQHGRNGHTVPAGDLDALVKGLLHATEGDTCERMRRESPQVFAEWQQTANPIAEFRQAMAHCGLLRHASNCNPPPSPPAARAATACQLCGVAMQT
jgi:glycosyltransferase involved in cell wall biosynthesis